MRRDDLTEAGSSDASRELGSLRGAWERARDETRCELVTVVGDAGVGKSRLVAEAVGLMRGGSSSGRCLPYGEGITYWPVVEVLKQLAVLPPDDTAVAAIRSLLGESDAPTSAEEIAWAFRKTLEHAAAERAVGRRLRRHPVGRADVPRPDRARRAALDRAADPPALRRPPGAHAS